MRNFLGHVADVWQPTFENVVREFINDTGEHCTTDDTTIAIIHFLPQR